MNSVHPGDKQNKLSIAACMEDMFSSASQWLGSKFTRFAVILSHS
jgi:hypothetical protein